jgi:hypothetical protein
MFLEKLGRGNKEDRPFLPAAAESVLMPAICLLLCLWLRPKDPFFVAAQFPWIWLAPVLVGLRYGSAAALLASLTLACGWALASARGFPLPPDIPRGYFLGGFITALLCGEFRDLALAEIRRERKTREHLGSRLEELGHAHQVLAQSHERLMTDFIGHPPTLRDALAEVPRPASGRLDAESAQALLVFLARFFQLETASLHLMEADGLRAQPIAALGPARRLDGTETLIAACLKTESLCHALEDAKAPGPYLFAAPLAPTGGSILALLAVEKVPFFAFQPENLRGLAAVLGYYADNLAASAVARQVLAQIPECPEDFAAGYLRLCRLHATSGIPGVVAACVVSAGTESAIPVPRRSADISWRREGPDGGADLILLMPFCGEEQARTALARLPNALGGIRVLAISKQEPIQALAAFLASLSAQKIRMPVSPVGKRP